MNKRDYNYIFGWAIVYELIITMVSGVAAIFWHDEGLIMLLAVLTGTAVLWLGTFRKQKRIPYSLFDRSYPVRRMTIKAFAVIISFLFLFQNLSTYLVLWLDDLGVGGALTGLELNNIEMTRAFILYAALIGPIIEELTFRGFVGRLSLRGGRVLAIFISALAFGLMHMNIGQFVAGLLLGIVFGYTATEYGLIWSIILHVLNNGVLAMLPTLLPEPLQTWILYAITGLMILCSIFAIYYFIRYNKKIREYIAEYRSDRSEWSALLKSIAFWIYVIAYVIIIILYAVFSPLLGL